MQAGEAQGIIVARLNRFARSNVGALAAIERTEKAGGDLISVDEQIDSSTPAGRFPRSILLAAAEWERERIAKGWVASRSSAVNRGIHVSRHVPPGYVRTPRSTDAASDRRLVPDPIHADHVRQAFKMATAVRATPRSPRTSPINSATAGSSRSVFHGCSPTACISARLGAKRGSPTHALT